MLEPASEAEVEAFEAWLRSDADHARAYADAEMLSSSSARLPHRLASGTPPRTRLGGFRPAYGFAAALGLVVAALWLVAQPPQPAYAAIANPGPSVRGITLSDGSTVILDAGAKIEVVFDRTARTATLLAGRARFNVTGDENRLFLVNAGQAVLTARRTIIDVALAPAAVRVSVIAGDAALGTGTPTHPSDREIRLTAGAAATVSDGRLDRVGFDAAALRWPAARLAFDDAPLSEIVGVANRRGDPKLLIADDAVARLRVTGVLDVRETRPLARKLAATLDLQIEERPDGILLKR